MQQVSGASVRKIRFFGPEMRLAASEGPKIAQIGRGGEGGSGKPREAQGDLRSSSEMSGASFRKIRFFGPGRRLAASEEPKIAQIGSLALGPPLAPRFFSFVPAKLGGGTQYSHEVRSLVCVITSELYAFDSGLL